MNTVDTPITIDFDKETPENDENEIKEYLKNKIKEIEYNKGTENTNKRTEDLIYELKHELIRKELNIEIDKVINDQRNDEPIEKFLNFCVKKCIKDNDPGFMFEVADKLPDLAKNHYSPVANLIKQITYVKIPSTWCDEENVKLRKFNSDKENLWSYKFPDPKSTPSSLFDRLVHFFLISSINCTLITF
jgi:hypothetical protein